MRLIVDTAIMVAALRGGTGNSGHLLAAGLERRFTMMAERSLAMSVLRQMRLVIDTATLVAAIRSATAASRHLSGAVRAVGGL
jgi:predicted nucleic acid-binding protein